MIALLDRSLKRLEEEMLAAPLEHHVAKARCRCDACCMCRDFLKCLRLKVLFLLGCRSSVLEGCTIQGGVGTDSISAVLTPDGQGHFLLNVPPDKVWGQFQKVLQMPPSCTLQVQLGYAGPAAWLSQAAAGAAEAPDFRLALQSARASQQVVVGAQVLFPSASRPTRGALRRLTFLNMTPHDIRGIHRAWLGQEELAAGVLSLQASHIRTVVAISGVNHSLLFLFLLKVL